MLLYVITSSNLFSLSVVGNILDTLYILLNVLLVKPTCYC